MVTHLALLAGIVASDGHLERDGHGVKVVSTSQEFISNCVLPLIRLATHKEPSVYLGRTGFSNRLKYIAYVYDEALSNVLSSRFSIPLGKKAEIILSPQGLSFKEEVDYIRGWFAGEGCISLDSRKTSAGIYRTPQIELWVKSKSIADWLDLKLVQRGIFSTKHFGKRDGQYLLIIRRKDSVAKFAKLIGFAHPEKDAKLRRILRLADPRIRTSRDSSVASPRSVWPSEGKVL